MQDDVQETLQAATNSNDDTDSAYADSEVSSFTTSLRSSILEYHHELGRRFHAYRAGRHLFPNDDQEQDRLDMNHAMIMLICDNNLYYAPIKDPQRVLDLGTGTGIWAIDFADAYPESEVIGNDLSPIQPTWVPPNLKFVVDDIEDHWSYEQDYFDYIHARYLAGSIKDWPKLMKQAYSRTRPLGWVEFQDWDYMIESYDGSIPNDCALMEWHKILHKRLENSYHSRPGPFLEGWVRDAGFSNVTVRKFAVPFHIWPKDPRQKQIGAFNFSQWEAGVEGMTIGTLTRVASDEPAWSLEEIQVLVAKVKADARNRKYHGFYSFYVVCGQKPE